MAYDRSADRFLAYFRADVLAAYQQHPDKFAVHTDYFEGKVETTGAYFAVLMEAGRTSEAIDVRFGYRARVDGELAVVAWMPDLVGKSATHVRQWSAFRIDERLAEWLPAEQDGRFLLWIRRHVEGDWSVENGPAFALGETIALINGLTLEAANVRLFDVDDVRVTFPAAENSHRYADAHRELYGIVVDGLDKRAIEALAACERRTVVCDSDRTLQCLRKAFPALDAPSFTAPLATVSTQRRLAAHKVRPAPMPMRAFDSFTADLRACINALDFLLRVLQGTFGLDPVDCRERQDALRHLRKIADQNLPANYGIHAARKMVGKTVLSVEVGEGEAYPGVHRSELVHIHFSDGSIVALGTGTSASGLRPRLGETDINPEDLHVDFIVEWVPPSPKRLTEPTGDG